MKSKIIITTLFILVVTTVFVVNNKTMSVDIESTTVTTIKTNNVLPSIIPVSGPQLENQKLIITNTESSTRIPTGKISKQQATHYDRLPTQELWQRSDGSIQKPYPFGDSNDINYEYVKVNREVINALSINDEIPLYIPQLGLDYFAKVKTITKSASGNTIYIASIISSGRSYQTILTQGSDSTYANISTPDGDFRLKGKGKDAWVYNHRDFLKTVDYSKTDIVIPPYSQTNTK